MSDNVMRAGHGMARKGARWLGLAALAGSVAACTVPEEILPGLREELRSAPPAEEITAAQEAADYAADTVTYAPDSGPEDRAAPINLGGAQSWGDWTHRAGNAEHRLAHMAFSTAPQLRWTASIGQGEDRRHRITAEPVSDGSRIFTLDSRAQVVATSTAGATLWSADLTPPSERTDDASGGGLALGSGLLFATTGFGQLVAIDPATGAVAWRQNLESPVSGAPTTANGLVYVTTDDNRGWAVNAADGRVQWVTDSLPSSSGVQGVAAPALAGRAVIFPFGSGELTAALRRGGLRIWSSTVAGSRPGRAYAILSDIPGEPVYANGNVYAGNAAGVSVAIDGSGERLWTAREGAQGPMLVLGGSVFMVSDASELVRLDAATGERIWGTELPGYEPVRRERKRRAIYANLGPVAAGGLLWVASSDGVMRAFDPVDGSAVTGVQLPGPAASRPIIVNGTAYLVTTGGTLLALR